MSILKVFRYILIFFVEKSRTTSRGLSGHFWPTGHRLGNPAWECGNCHPWDATVIGTLAESNCARSAEVAWTTAERGADGKLPDLL